jgi:hypothetical protein
MMLIDNYFKRPQCIPDHVAVQQLFDVALKALRDKPETMLRPIW